MSELTTIGLDLAKQVFHAVCCDRHGNEVGKKTLRRHQVLDWFAQQPACLIGMEACGGSHYRARQLQALGHEVRLIPAQHVRAYVRGQKNDRAADRYNDARAIAEAVVRPGMRVVAVKTVEQQDVQALHRLRQGRIAERTALCNQLRGVLGEYGLIVPQGVAALRRRLPELLEDADNGLSAFLRPLLAHGYQHLCALDEQIACYTRQLEAHAREHEPIVRLQTIPGFGPVMASVFHSVVGDGQAYRRGRDVAAAVGLVPKQHSSGGKPVLLGISKRGDRYLRSLLVHGARSVLRQAARKDSALSRWACRIQARRGTHKAIVALANKLARIGWAVLRHHTVYQPA